MIVESRFSGKQYLFEMPKFDPGEHPYAVLAEEDLNGTIFVNQSLDGIGDIVQAAYAVAAVKNQNPQRKVVFEVLHHRVDVATLFRDADEVRGVERTRIVFEPSQTKFKDNVLNYLCRLAGVGSATCRPSVVDLPGIDWAQLGFKGCPVLFVPEATQSCRMWPTKSWIELAEIFKRKGVEFAFLTKSEGYGPPLWKNVTPKDLFSIVNSARAVVALESGMAHVAGVLDKLVLCLAGPTNAAAMMGGYPSARWIQAGECSPCNYKPANGYTPECRYSCQALNLVSPADVWARVKELI